MKKKQHAERCKLEGSAQVNRLHQLAMKWRI